MIHMTTINEVEDVYRTFIKKWRTEIYGIKIPMKEMLNWAREELAANWEIFYTDHDKFTVHRRDFNFFNTEGYEVISAKEYLKTDWEKTPYYIIVKAASVHGLELAVNNRAYFWYKVSGGVSAWTFKSWDVLSSNASTYYRQAMTLSKQ